MKDLNEDQKELATICSLALLRVINTTPNDRVTVNRILQSENHLLGMLEESEPYESKSNLPKFKNPPPPREPRIVNEK